MAETEKGKKVVYPYSYKRADGTRCLRTSAPPHTSEGPSRPTTTQARAEVEIARAQAHADSAREIAETEQPRSNSWSPKSRALRADLRRSRLEP